MDVPEDILDEAEAITAKLSDIWLWDSLKREEATRIIAQALLSERLAQKERDAKIAEETGKAYCRDHFVMMGPAGIAHSIMLAIRQS